MAFSFPGDKISRLLPRYPRAICRGYRFWNQAANTPTSNAMEHAATARAEIWSYAVAFVRCIRTGSKTHAAMLTRLPQKPSIAAAIQR